jgi:hypothetical protein
MQQSEPGWLAVRLPKAAKLMMSGKRENFVLAKVNLA